MDVVVGGHHEVLAVERLDTEIIRDTPPAPVGQNS
jgi:hypothetical protein